MISVKSFINFMTTNSGLLLLGSANYYAISTFDKYISNRFIKLFFILCITLSKNYILIHAINYMLRHHSYINNTQTQRLSSIKEKYKGEFHINIIQSSIVESLAIVYIQTILPLHSNILYDIITFIPKSLLFELIFDFFHYWTHRYMHYNKTLYRYSHKKHHTYKYPTTYITFYQHPLDIILTNAIPLFLTLYILKRYFVISYYLFTIINTYKTHTEIAGHSGKDVHKSSSFPQCMWLVKLLNIELYTHDHDKHHSKSSQCNYSKRFIIWDKIFKTYK